MGNIHLETTKRECSKDYFPNVFVHETLYHGVLFKIFKNINIELLRKSAHTCFKLLKLTEGNGGGHHFLSLRIFMVFRVFLPIPEWANSSNRFPVTCPYLFLHSHLPIPPHGTQHSFKVAHEGQKGLDWRCWREGMLVLSSSPSHFYIDICYLCLVWLGLDNRWRHFSKERNGGWVHLPHFYQLSCLFWVCKSTHWRVNNCSHQQ